MQTFKCNSSFRTGDQQGSYSGFDSCNVCAGGHKFTNLSVITPREYLVMYSGHVDPVNIRPVHD